MSTTSRASRRALASAAGLAVAASGLAFAPAQASPDGTGLVISEVYGAGGNSGATYNADFVELYNPTAAAISVGGLGLQYRSAAGGSGGVAAVTGTVPAGEHFLVQMSSASATVGDPLPTPDFTSGSINMSGSAGQVLLLPTTTPYAGSGDVAGKVDVIDAVGFGTSPTTYEGAVTGANLTSSTSAQRGATGADSDNNAADFAKSAPTPENTGGSEPPPPPEEFTGSIAEIQGTDTDTSPHVDDIATTQGVVTAAYPSGGFYGYVIQTPGTGGADDATPGASDALYVYQPAGSVDVVPGDYVEVKGVVSEYQGLTEIAVNKTDLTDLGAAPAPVTALAVDYPTTDAAREAHESELLDVSGQHFTVTDNYSTNQYAEIGLATGDIPLLSPTEVADAQDAAAIAAVKADNARRAVTLDDAASINFLPFGGPSPSQDIPLPWLSPTNPVRVSSAVTFHEPVILDYRNSTWKFQPTHQVTDEGQDVATFTDTRTENAAPQDVGGDLRLATFNVLNYFPTTGMEFEAGGGSCSYYVDRADDPVTDNTCTPDGPRGAAEDEDLQRQQIKIVTAINKLGADIVSLEEIENSVKFGKDRDDAVSTLVNALNAEAGSTRWAYAPSPAAGDLPPTADQDVIRTAFIYDPHTVDLVGGSVVLTGSDAFYNARQPLAQAFKPHGATAETTFGVIVNHFKSKGSGVDDGTGQGNANPDRVAQAHALSTFANDFQTDRGISSLFLTGDFNAYSMEDPVQVLEDDGYTNLQSDTPDEWTYNFDSQAGSLDHVFANAAALSDVTGVDIWNINADEAVAFEYSRDNYNATDFYQANQFRASDHDPEVVGIDVPGFPAEPTGEESSIDVKVTPKKVKEDKTRVRLGIRVDSDGPTPSGTVEVQVEGQTYTAPLVNGRAEVELPPFDSAGTRTVTVTYSGDDATQPSTTTTQIDVEEKPGNGHGHGGGHGHHRA